MRVVSRLKPTVLAVLAALGCAGEPTVAPPEPDRDSQRVTPSGTVVGFVSDDGAHVWRGLPFARPPLGALRWRAPQPPEAWSGTRRALAFGDACPQFAGAAGRRLGLAPDAPRGSEDCLYANVFAPPFPPAEVPRGDARLPVMVWIHGGGNTIGDAVLYDGSRLAVDQQVVVVTLHYRLGVLGWFTHPSLRAGADPLDQSGNYAVLDLVRALEWVRDHIGAFGGDPQRVTIFGESAGGSNVFALLRSPLARGLFQRAIVQSGGLRAVPITDAERYADAVPPGDPNSSSEVLLRLLVAQGVAADRDAAKAEAARMSDERIAAFLRERSAAELLAVFDGAGLGGMYRHPQMLRDGFVLPDVEAERSFDDAADYNAVPVVLGTNRDENKLFLLLGSDYVSRLFGLPIRLKDPRRYELDAEYQSLMWKATGVDEPAAAMRAAQTDGVFAYRFDWDEEPRVLWLDFARLLGACHALEIPFVFGILDLGFANRFLIDEARRPAAEALSDAMMSYWAAFAYGGDPGRGRDGTLPRWSAWSDGPGDKFIVLDSEAGGGLRMSADTVTKHRVLDRIAADDRFEGDRERCELYRGFVEWSGRLTEEEYGSIADGACRDWPLGDRS